MALIPEIREKIDAWLEGGVDRSPAELARRAGLPYSTARRILQGECTPTYTSLGAILSLVAPDTEVVPLLFKQFPDKVDFLKKHFHGESATVDQPLKTFLADQLATVIYGFITASKNLTVENIRTKFGEQGLEKMHLLDKAGLISVSGESHLISSTEAFNVFDPNSFKQLVSAHADCIRVQNISNERGYVTFRNDSVSRDGYAEIISILERASAEIKSVMECSTGSIPVHFSGFADSDVEVGTGNEEGNK